MGTYVPVAKKTRDVDIVLALPDDFHWKVYGKLIEDLGVQGEDINEIRGAVRRRDVDSLFTLLPKFEPRCMLELTDAIDERFVSRQAHSFFCRYQLGAFLKKYPFKGQDTETPALQKFRKAEEQCKLFNDENHKALVFLDQSHPDYFGILEELREDIGKVLGVSPPLGSIIGHAKHGPGVSLGDSYKGGMSTSFYKWSNLPYSVTTGTLALARAAIESDQRWIGALYDWYRTKNAVPMHAPVDAEAFWAEVLTVVDGSRITTVPKTALTDRTIAIEPLLNVYLQLGVDHIIKAGLRRAWGYDLTTQSRNQKLAYEGSRDGRLATVDLAAASDTVSLKICELLLPAQWFDLLFDLRCPNGVLKGNEQVSFEKISSMGNGFTFALESLIFGALVRCAIRRTKSVRESAVYGDDLIVPTTAYPMLLSLLNLCGFKTNEDKTFSSGPFRESCGTDYYSGYDVRPLFLKNQLKTVPDLFYMHNSLCLLEKRLNWAWGVDFSRTKAFIKRYIPQQYAKICIGPQSEDLDTHLFVEEDVPRRSDGFRCHWALIPRAATFKTAGKCFLFRKLMAQLRASSPRKWWEVPLKKLQPKWERERERFNSGNVFDVTRRDHVIYDVVPQFPVSIGDCDRKPLPDYLTRSPGVTRVVA